VIKCVDNRAAITRINKTLRKGLKWRCYADDINIVTVIVDQMKESTLQHWLRWVKAHPNRAAITQINQRLWKGSKKRCYADDINIVTVIVDQMKESTPQHQLQWVKAHQDDKCPYEDLNIWGHMNCDADQLAEKFHEWVNWYRQSQADWGRLLY
jgi:uncharacterized membrane protein YkvA (DUF1232 family)